MPDRFLPDAEPVLPTEFDAPKPGEVVASAVHRAVIKAVLNLSKWVQTKVWQKSEEVDAAKLGGKGPGDYWQKTETLPTGSSDAATLGGYTAAQYLRKDERANSAYNSDLLDGLDSTDFWKKTDAVNATMLQGYSAASFLLKSEAESQITIPIRATGLGNATVPGDYDNLLSLNFRLPAGKTTARLVYLQLDLRYGPVGELFVTKSDGTKLIDLSGVHDWDDATAPAIWIQQVQDRANGNALFNTANFILGIQNNTGANQTYGSTIVQGVAIIKFY